jgi:hypothetical protein
MRKLLLASVAGLGAWGAMASDSVAQTPPPTSAPATMSYPAGPMSGLNLPTGAAPSPGTVVVRLNGRFRFYAFSAWDQDAQNNAAGSATGTVNTTTGLGTLTGGNKLSNVGFGEFARLYPGFDGIAANGLKYGVSLEIRQDQVSGAGGGSFGSISQQNRARGALYFRREWAYLGTDQVGTFRFGSVDSPASLYMVGNFENYNDGAWNGDLPALIAGVGQLLWPFADTGNYYTTNKLVYLSPSLFGFDMGLSYEPNTGNVSAQANCGTGTPVGTNFVNPAGSFLAAAGANGTGAASAGCDRLSSSPINAESARRRNTFEALLRYRGSFGAFGVAATGAYIASSHVLDNQTGVAFNANPLNGLPIRQNYQGLNMGDFGLQVTFGGLSVGGKYQFGTYNGQIGTLEPAGFSNSRVWLAGASYTAGPIIVGGSYFVNNFPGDLPNAFFGRQRREAGLAVGGTYALAPGVSIYLSGLWGERKQNGFDFITGQSVSAATPNGVSFNNKVTVSAVSLGTAFSW